MVRSPSQATRRSVTKISMHNCRWRDRYLARNYETPKLSQVICMKRREIKRKREINIEEDIVRMKDTRILTN